MSWHELERDSVTTYYLRKGTKGCSEEAVLGSSCGGSVLPNHLCNLVGDDVSYQNSKRGC